MKTLAFALITAAVCIGFGQPAGAASTTSPTKYFVTVQGHLAPVTGSPEATMTFSHEVQIPGATLPAGTYLFSLVTPTTMRVMTEDGRKVLATFYTTSVTRTQNIDHAQVRFERMPGGTTRTTTPVGLSSLSRWPSSMVSVAGMGTWPVVFVQSWLTRTSPMFLRFAITSL